MLTSLLLMTLPGQWVILLRSSLLTVISPIDKVVAHSTEFLTRIPRAIFSKEVPPTEINFLRTERIALRSQRDAAIAEIARLKRTLKSMIDCKTVAGNSSLVPFPADVLEKPAKVIAVRNGVRDILRIAAGRTSGITEGVAVVHEKYVVGRVISTGLDSAQVQLVTDPGFRAAAVTHPGGVEGTIHGEAGPRCIMKHVLKTDRVKVKDLVLTSGFAGIFPRGFVIGYVSKVTSTYDARFQRVEVAPAIMPEELETVIVLIKPDNTP